MLTCIRLRENYLTTVLLSFSDVDYSRESQGGRRKKYYGSFASGANGSMLTCIRFRENYLTTVLLSFSDVD